MFNCPGKVCRHLPGYFFARSLGTGKFPVIVFMPGILDIRTKEKVRRSLDGLLLFSSTGWRWLTEWKGYYDTSPHNRIIRTHAHISTF